MGVFLFLCKLFKNEVIDNTKTFEIKDTDNDSEFSSRVFIF